MIKFNVALEDFFNNNLDFEALREQLAQTLLDNPELVPDIASRLDELLQTKKLSASTYLPLKNHIEQFRAASLVSDDQTTRLESASGDQPVPLSASDDPAPTRLVRAPAPQDPDPTIIAELKAKQGNRSPSEAHSIVTSQMPETGVTLNGRFVLDGLIGRGGMGSVYRALDLRKQEALDRDPYVAVKVLNEEFHGDPEAFIILQRETKKAQSLAHPNIATVYDFDRDGDTVYMTMELLKGESLEQLIKRVKPDGVSLADAIPLLEGMANGLGYAHEQNIAHSDFKPGNVFITEGGIVKVLDFGIARAVKRPGQTVRDVTVFSPQEWGALTPAYASCEMFEQARPDPRDDIYAMACVAYELLAGRHPFGKLPANRANQRKLQADPIPELNNIQNRALMRGLAFDRQLRTASTAEFIAELKNNEKSVSNLWKGVVALGVIAVLIVVGLVFIPTSTTDNGTEQAKRDRIYGAAETQEKSPELVAKEASISRPPTDAIVDVKTVIAKPDAETKAKIERILEIADLHFLVGRFVKPEGSNAVEAYRAILELHPANRNAIAGLHKIATHFEIRAVSSHEKGEIKQALSEVKLGLKANSKHAGLLQLQKQIQTMSKN